MRASNKLLLPFLLISLLGLQTPSFAGHHDDNNEEEGEHAHKHDKHHKDHDHEEQGEYSGPYFNQQRVAILRDFYTAQEIDSLPPGLRKHLERTGHLPPGIEKKLIREGRLPPEYENELVPVPGEVIGRLGPLPPDARLYMYNGDAILLNPKNQAILDIVHGVLQLKEAN